MINKKFFSKMLLDWDKHQNTREMPWKGERDPYKIWISEIILQQTRVQQGLGYYYKFIKTFPNVKSLADSTEQRVFKLWEGLGYYSRCRNLITSAKFITTQLQGKFPEKYEDILALKGIGNYTASAIASFAYNQPYAVLDGNVYRVLSRFFGIEISIDSNDGKKLYALLARELLHKDNPGKYNQAIMDFGAIVCKPVNPLCEACPLRPECIALKKAIVNMLPVKKKGINRRERFFNYLIVEYRDTFYVQKRNGKDIWQGLYEFILIETPNLLADIRLQETEEFSSLFSTNDFIITCTSKMYTQKLTHQTITGKFFHIHLQKPLKISDKLSRVSKKQLAMLPFPKFITSYLKD